MDPPRELERRHAVGRHGRVVAGVPDDTEGELEVVRLVLHDEDARHPLAASAQCSGSARGSSSTNVEPRPRPTLDAVMVPPCASAMSRAT